VLPGEEGEDGSGAARLVAEVEVVGAGVVEIHRSLHEPEADGAGVEIEIALRPPRDGCDMMDAVHGVLLVPRRRGLPVCRRM